MAKKKMNKGKRVMNPAPAFMISEDMSQPGNMPRGAKSMKFPYVECGGQMMDASIQKSDRAQDSRARDIKKQSPSDQF